MCAVLSQAKKNLKALEHAKLALLICEDNLIKTYYLFMQLKSKNVNLLENDDDILNNEKKYDFNCDIWSLGIVLFELISNKLKATHVAPLTDRINYESETQSKFKNPILNDKNHANKFQTSN